METFEAIKTATNLKYGARSAVVESINLEMILYTEAKKRPRKTQSKHGTGERVMNQKCCTTCDRVYVNEMTDERYCSLKDHAQIKLRWHKHRPDWCPKLKKNRRASDDT